MANVKNVDFTPEIQYLGNIKAALEQVSIKGADAVTYSNILQAIDTLAKAIDDKQTDINKMITDVAAAPAPAECVG